MTCRRGGGPFNGRLAGFLLVGTSAATAFMTGVSPLGAAADNGHGRGVRAQRNVVTPAGKDPRDRPDTRLAVEGSTRNRGYQHTSANTAGGSSNVQNALCRGARVCNITQHVTVAGPRETAQPALKPVPVPTVTVTVTVTPTPVAAPAPRPAVAPTPPVPTPAVAPAPCPATSLVRVGARVNAMAHARVYVSSGLITGLVSLSVLGKGTACPVAYG
ncbi:hypothetical protein [Microbispora sp. H11081]|uniref:hypothetical protein n=1 Tax=Microbispora sp. H11081 TaxID=2729107 RepID=UPI0014743A29|nr:hypothetical protein [Microbispora sp. H11081]